MLKNILKIKDTPIIKLVDSGKKFSKEWIFRKLTFNFHANEPCSILGSNGSGKSTLIQSLLGFQTLTEGDLQIFHEVKKTPLDISYPLFSFAAPYLTLYEDFTLLEAIRFHDQLKPFFDTISIEAELNEINLWKSRDKQLKNFSSGMKQRVKLMLALFSDTPILLLDEPTANLDSKGIKWYQDKLTFWSKGRILIVASNHIEEEIFLCQRKLNMEDYKS